MLENAAYQTFMSVTQLNLHGQNSQINCSSQLRQQNQDETSLKSPLHFKQRVLRLGQAVLPLRRAPLAF